MREKKESNNSMKMNHAYSPKLEILLRENIVILQIM